MSEPASDTRRDQILDAALTKFGAYGFARTSMSDIAAAASISRPGLYLHFENKEAIYRAVLERTLDRSSTAALAALDATEDVEMQLDGFLQRTWGDLSDWTLATEHGDDLIQAKAGHARDVSEANTARVRRGLGAHLTRVSPSSAKSTRDGWRDLLVLSPIGLKYDNPTISVYRKRLSRLARSIAADIAAD